MCSTNFFSRLYRLLSLSCSGFKAVSKSKQVYEILSLYFNDNLYSLTMTDKLRQLLLIETIKQSIAAQIVPQPFAEAMIRSVVIHICQGLVLYSFVLKKYSIVIPFKSRVGQPISTSPKFLPFFILVTLKSECSFQSQKEHRRLEDRVIEDFFYLYDGQSKSKLLKI